VDEASEREPAALPTQRPRLVRAELRKIFTTRSWWVVGILLLLATMLALLDNISDASDRIALAEFAVEHPPPEPEPGQQSAAQRREILDEWAASTDFPRILAEAGAAVYTSGQYFGLLLVAILGALMVTNEFQHQTATATFLATPRRARVIAAKLIAAVLLAAGFWLAATALSIGIGSASFAALGHGIPFADPTTLRAIGMNLLAYTVWAVLGVSLGVLLRGQLGATLTTAFLYLSALPALLFFGLLYDLIQQDWVYDLVVLMPGMASQIMVEPGRLELNASTVAPPWWVGAVVLVGYGAVGGTIGTIIMRRRDVS
jgi:ABC-type transport system involved in multi-copper enzyme maturation permease subunit